jgi:hypothetical protein
LLKRLTAVGKHRAAVFGDDLQSTPVFRRNFLHLLNDAVGQLFLVPA